MAVILKSKSVVPVKPIVPVKPAAALVKPAPVKAAPTPPAPVKAAPPATVAGAVKAGGLSFLKKGKAAQEQMAKEDHKQEMNSKGKVSRYWLKDGTDGQVTFLDGGITDGVLDIPFFYEHNINMNGKWGNFFICTQDEEPCPVCEGGATPSYVGVLTVIDHSEYTSKKDGKVYKDQRRMFVAKRETIKILQKIAVKRGGLRGCKFDVSRTGDKSASVGNVFDFTDKTGEAGLLSTFKLEAVALNYEEILANLYMPAKELRKLGFGNMNTPIGGEQGPTEDYEGAM